MMPHCRHSHRGTGGSTMNDPEKQIFTYLQVSQAAAVVALALLCLVQSPTAFADDDADFRPGNLLVSRVVYDNNPNNIVAGVTLLPPGCVGSACTAAAASGAYPSVWNNVLVDGSFGITSRIVLDQMTRLGLLISTLEVPNSSQRHIAATSDQMVGSFSSKSEVALNLSTDKR